MPVMGQASATHVGERVLQHAAVGPQRREVRVEAALDDLHVDELLEQVDVAAEHLALLVRVRVTGLVEDRERRLVLEHLRDRDAVRGEVAGRVDALRLLLEQLLEHDDLAPVGLVLRVARAVHVAEIARDDLGSLQLGSQDGAGDVEAAEHSLHRIAHRDHLPRMARFKVWKYPPTRRVITSCSSDVLPRIDSSSISTTLFVPGGPDWSRSVTGSTARADSPDACASRNRSSKRTT